MFRNYLKTAWRNITNNKFYSVINVSGLALGLATGIMLLLWAQNEKSYDRFNHDYKNIYRLNAQINSNGKTITWSDVPGPVAVFAGSLPNIKSVVRIHEDWGQVLSDAGKTKILDGFNIAYADTSFFSIFNYDLVYGDEAQSLADAHSVILTQETAGKLFGNENAVGKTIRFSQENFLIRGILKNFPANSSLKYDAVFPMSAYADWFTRNGGNGDWKTIDEDLGNYSFSTFIKLNPASDAAQTASALTRSYREMRNSDQASSFSLQPLEDIHLISPGGNSSALQMVRIFILIAVMLLLIAGINYVNLSTARSLIRAREVSVRKIIGANKGQLFTQFVLETTLLFFFATIAAILLIYLLMPLYNQVSGKSLEFSFSNGEIWKVLIFAAAGTLMAASIYPALLLSSFNPIRALKGRMRAGAGTANFRKGLVVFQFAISVILIVSTLAITRQMRYVMERNPGYDRSYVFSVPLPDAATGHADAIKNELSANGSVLNVAFSNIYNVSNIGNATGDIDWKGKPDNFSMIIAQANIDKDFIPAMKMQFVEGGNFTGVPADSAHYIVNEKAVKMMGFSPPYTGKEISFHGKKGTIKGVLRDFNFRSLKNEIDPLIFSFFGYRNILYVRTAPQKAEQAVAAVRKVYKEYGDGMPFSYSFADKQFEGLYRSDLQAGLLFKVFAGIAIFISCLGLLGLATYTAQVRTKEIGVRKVLGASVSNIVRLLSSDFLRLILISVLIAVPAGWYLMNKWLGDYAYRIELGWQIFAIGVALVVLIALTTIGFQACKAARANPVKSLRSE